MHTKVGQLLFVLCFSTLLWSQLSCVNHSGSKAATQKLPQGASTTVSIPFVLPTDVNSGDSIKWSVYDGPGFDALMRIELPEKAAVSDETTTTDVIKGFTGKDIVFVPFRPIRGVKYKDDPCLEHSPTAKTRLGDWIQRVLTNLMLKDELDTGEPFDPAFPNGRFIYLNVGMATQDYIVFVALPRISMSRLESEERRGG